MDDRLRVVIVEDEATISLILREIVEETVPAIVFVHTSVKTAENAMNDGLDLAILDINLTNGKSYELAKKLRREHVPFSFVSSSLKEDMPEELLDAPFIPKPFRDSQIRQLVLEAFDKKVSLLH